MEHTKEIVAELAAHFGVGRVQAKKMIADYYGRGERTIYDWIARGTIYEYGLIVEAVKELKAGNTRANPYQIIRRYHEYDGYDSPQERLLMLSLAFELVQGEKVLTHAELQQLTLIPRSTLFKCMARLEEKGLVKRERLEDEKAGVKYKL